MDEEKYTGPDRRAHPKPKDRVGFTVGQLVALVVFVMLLATFGAIFGSNLILDSASTDEVQTEVKTALVKSCKAIEGAKETVAARTEREQAMLRAQVVAFESLLDALRSSAIPPTQQAVLNRDLDSVIEKLNDLRAESLGEVVVPNCDLLIESLN